MCNNPEKDEDLQPVGNDLYVDSAGNLKDEDGNTVGTIYDTPLLDNLFSNRWKAVFYFIDKYF